MPHNLRFNTFPSAANQNEPQVNLFATNRHEDGKQSVKKIEFACMHDDVNQVFSLRYNLKSITEAMSPSGGCCTVSCEECSGYNENTVSCTCLRKFWLSNDLTVTVVDHYCNQKALKSCSSSHFRRKKPCSFSRPIITSPKVYLRAIFGLELCLQYKAWRLALQFVLE